MRRRDQKGVLFCHLLGFDNKGIIFLVPLLIYQYISYINIYLYPCTLTISYFINNSISSFTPIHKTFLKTHKIPYNS